MYKYLFKRLVNMNVEDLQRNNQAHNGNHSDDANDSYQQDDTGATVPESEERIEILCNSQYVSSSLQLADVRRELWNSAEQGDDLLILHYRRRITPTEHAQIGADRQYVALRDS